MYEMVNILSSQHKLKSFLIVAEKQPRIVSYLDLAMSLPSNYGNSIL